MKAFLLLSAAWLSGAGGNPTTPAPLPATGTPTAAPVAAAPGLPPAPFTGASPVYGHPGQVIGSPVIGQAPSGPCCGNTGGAVVGAPVAMPYPTQFAPQGVVSGPISGCACDPCATGAPAPAAGALAPAAAPATGGGLFGHHKGHLFHKLFGKKTDTAGEAFNPVSSAPVASAPVVGGSCGCETAPAAPAAPAQAPGFFSRMFGARPAPAPAPISAAPYYSPAPVYSGAPGCSNCGQSPVISGGFPQGQIYQAAPGQLPTTFTPYPSNPVPGTPVVTPGTPTTNPGNTPLPKGPEGIKEAPKEPQKLPAVGEKGLQPTSGTQFESGGSRPFDDHHRQRAQLGSAADFSTVTGKLMYVHVDGGLWILRYASLDRVDRNGGSVVLPKDRRMDSYREGDIVTVMGQLTAEKASPRLAAPLYQVNTIHLVERPTN